uniref:Terpene cyclase/mutase family member n=1 Tax=Kalanchoe fedtschenkoi TaxID=63787 RepID=A0A7N0TBU7_KALFE
MWKLKIGEGKDKPYLFSTNNYVGRRVWEFDPHVGTAQELVDIETARLNFKVNRHNLRTSSDLICHMQLLKEKGFKQTIPRVRVGDGVEPTNEATTAALRRVVHFYSALQASDGHWPTENSGPLFHMPPFVMFLYVTGHLETVFSAEHRKEMLRYIYNHQNQDGGWGLHIEGRSTMFCTALNYIAMRLLGEGPNGGQDDAVSRARQWIHDRGGVIYIPSCGKAWLSVMGLFDWSGTDPIPPELWLVPSSIPLSPAQMFCATRLAFMPMSYLYGKRFVGPITPLILQLREELHTIPYHEICWSEVRHLCYEEDCYCPHSRIQNLLWDTLYHTTEPLLACWPFKSVRERALRTVMDHVHYDDENSRYLSVGSFEKALCMLACWVEDPNGDSFKKHLARIPDYLWLAEDGMKIMTPGCQSWEASLTVQALLASSLTEEIGETLAKAHDFLQKSQVTDNPSGDFKSMYRHISKGSWTFSDKDYGWQVSDCTAEGLKSCLLLSMMPPEIVGERMEPQKFYDAVNVILSLQSKKGGISAWEPASAHEWLELFNPSELFADVVIDHDYIECTSSAIQALYLFKTLYPDHRKDEIRNSVEQAAQFILNTQRADGSWCDFCDNLSILLYASPQPSRYGSVFYLYFFRYGSWGICFTYATWFALAGLAAHGMNHRNCAAVRRGVEFLLRTQLEDGGWGESYRSCPDMKFTPLDGNKSHLVQTSWALMGLIHAGQVSSTVTPAYFHFQIKS